jgi:hypothetical protein
VLRLKVKMDELEETIDDLRSRAVKASGHEVVPPDKSIVVSRRSYDLVIFED